MTTIETHPAFACFEETTAPDWWRDLPAGEADRWFAIFVDRHWSERECSRAACRAAGRWTRQH
jgi:hypothetical protein